MLLVRVLAVPCTSIANGCSTKQLTFLSEEDASNSEEDTDSSVPLDYNQT